MAQRGRSTGYDRVEAERAREETLVAMHAKLAAQVATLDGQGAWQAWLRFAASLHRYSFNNTVLSWSQKPDATLVAGYRAWQAKGRQVRRGEKAIKVFGPVTRRQEVLDAQGRPARDASGQPLVETRMVGVKPVSVFDVSQTDGDPLPTQPEAKLLAGQAPDGLWQALQRFVEAQGFSVTREDCGGANGMTIFGTRQVLVRPDVDDAQACKTLAHEAAHVLLHAPDAREGSTCRGVAEVEAESVAYMVTQAHGLDSAQYTFHYVTGWAHQATTPDGPSVEDIVRATGGRVIAATGQILQATQPAPTVIDEALADLTIAVDHAVTQTRTPAVADTPAPARPAHVARWERVDRPHATRPEAERRPIQLVSPVLSVGVDR